MSTGLQEAQHVIIGVHPSLDRRGSQWYAKNSLLFFQRDFSVHSTRR